MVVAVGFGRVRSWTTGINGEVKVMGLWSNGVCSGVDELGVLDVTRT